MALISNGHPIPPQSLAETSPMAVTSYWYGHDGAVLTDYMATYSYIYRSQPVLSGIVDKVADLTARLTLQTWDTTDPDAASIDRQSEYAQLLRNPCLYLDPYSFWVWWVSTYEIYGEVYGYKLRDATGAVISICPMHPTRTWIERDENGNEKFTFSLGVANVGLLVARREDVILRRRYNPDTAMRGLSRLESLTRTIQNEDAIRTSVSSTWKRGAFASMAIKVPGNPNDKSMAALRAKVETLHSGPTKSGGVLLLPGGMEPVALQIDPQKMQLIDSLKLTREEMLIRYDFPPPGLQILDHATFSNITEQMRSMYRDSMAPRLEAIESTLDWDLRPEFYQDAVRYAKFDLDDVLRGDFETRASAVKDLVLNGIAMPSEARNMMGLTATDDPAAAKLYANQALQPLGTPVAGATPPPIPEPPTQRSIAGRLGRKAKDGRDSRIEAYRNEFLAAIEPVLEAQKATAMSLVEGKALFDVGPFDRTLTKALATVIAAVATNAGRTVASRYSHDDAPFDINTEASDVAHGINAQTMTAVNGAIENGGDIDHVFDVRLTLLAMTAMTLATRWSNEAELDSAIRFRKATTKTWVTGPNPRPSHAALNGQTVAIGKAFSNGQRHPGDGASDNANCNCRLDFA